MNPEPLLQYMLERHRIYLRRQQGQPLPWTEDEALQRIYLTNVYRELDKVTVWVDKNIRKPYAYSENLWLMLIMARLINHPETLKDLIISQEMGAFSWPVGPFNRKGVKQVLKSRTDKKLSVYGHAYMLWGGTQPGRPKYEVTLDIIENAWERRHMLLPYLTHTLEQTHKALSGLYGLAGFLAYEVVCDLRYTRYLENAPDVRTWAHAGPGAKRGINWLQGNDPKQRMSDVQALIRMQQLYAYITEYWPSEWPPLEMREIEHSLCEFSKVEAYRQQGKRPKRWYTGGLA